MSVVLMYKVECLTSWVLYWHLGNNICLQLLSKVAKPISNRMIACHLGNDENNEMSKLHFLPSLRSV